MGISTKVTRQTIQGVKFLQNFCASESSNISKTLTKLKWTDSTIVPYEKDTKKIEKYLKSN